MNTRNIATMTLLCGFIMIGGCSVKDVGNQVANTIRVPVYADLPRSNPNEGFMVHPLTGGEHKAVQEVLDNTNKLRREKGLPPLRLDPGLTAFAKVRAHELIKKFSHTRPDGSSYSSGIEGGYTGENIAAGSATAKETVMGQWKNSKGHYENITGAQYTTIGIGIAYDPKSTYGYYWVQVFSNDSVQSKYHFSDQAEKAASRAYTGSTLHIEGEVVPSNASHAFARGELTHPIYARTLRDDHEDGSYTLIQDPDKAGFTYQTFGEIYDTEHRPVDYVNIGEAQRPADDAVLQATYRGASIGNYGQHSHVYADVHAKVDYGRQRKVMDVEFYNSQIADHDISHHNTAQPLRAASQFDFRQSLQWDAGQARFVGDGVQAALYGNGREIGGQFRRTVEQSIYQGAFGAAKQSP